MMHFSPRRKSCDNGFQEMHGSVESLDFLHLEGLQDYTPGGQKNHDRERTLSLKQRLQNNLGIISPRRKSIHKSKSLDNTKSFQEAPLETMAQLERKKSKRGGKKTDHEWQMEAEQKPSPKKSPSKRSSTPFRRKTSRPQASFEDQTPKTPRTPLSKLRSITPFRRTPHTSDKTKEMQDSCENMLLLDLEEEKEKSKQDAYASPQPTSGGALSLIKQSVAKTFSPRRKSMSKASTSNSMHSSKEERRRKGSEKEICEVPRTIESKTSKGSRRASTPFRPRAEASAHERDTKAPSIHSQSQSRVSATTQKLNDDRCSRKVNHADKGHHSTSRKKQRHTTPSRKCSMKSSNHGGRSRSSPDGHPTQPTREHRPSSHHTGSSSTRQLSVSVDGVNPTQRRSSGTVCRPRACRDWISNHSGHSAVDSGRFKTDMNRKNSSEKHRPEEDELSPSSDSSSSSSTSISSFVGCETEDLNKSFVQLAVSGLEEKIMQVERTPGARPADVTLLASPLREQLSRTLHDFRSPTGSSPPSLPRSVSSGRGLYSPKKVSPRHSLNGSAHTRSKSLGRASAVARATIINEAPPTPRSRSRITDRRTLAELNDGVSLLSHRTNNSRGNNSKGASAARQTVLELPSMLTVGNGRKAT